MHKERSQASKKANNKMSTMCAIMCREVSGVNANRFTSRRQSPVKKGIEEHKTGDKSVVETLPIYSISIKYLEPDPCLLVEEEIHPGHAGDQEKWDPRSLR